MFIGINTNIQHKGEIYHVQTEDSGVDQHALTTILFKSGAILSLKKTRYSDIPESPSHEETVKKMMQQQHKQMLLDLVRGTLDLQNKPGPQKASKKHSFQAQRLIPKKGLDDLIMAYLAKKEAGQV